MTKIDHVLLTGKTHTTVSTKDGRLDINLSTPGKEANPDHQFAAIQPHPTAEQFFSGAWSACFIAAIGLVAQEKKVQLPSDLAVEVEVDLGKTGAAYFIQARFTVSLPGVAREVAEAIVHGAHEICPYSKATRGNIDVTTNIIAA